MSYLRINPQQKEQLRKIIKGGDGLFSQLHNALLTDERPSIKASSLFNYVLKIAKDRNYSNAFCTQMVGLATFRRERQRSTTAVVEQLIAGLPMAGFDPDEIEWFSDRKEYFIEMLDSESVRLPAKALNLSTDQAAIYYSGNVVTDIRPVFDGERDGIRGAVVIQNLKVRFFEDAGQSSQRVLSMALDNEDIDNLIEELEKAKKKSKACRVFFEEKADGDVYIIGEETYDFG